MANRYNGKIIVIDTTDTQIGGPNPTGGPTGDLHIKAIIWVATAAKAIADTNAFNIEWGKNGGDIVIACDAQLAALTGSMPYKVEFGGEPWIVPGLYVEDLGGGELQFFLA